jgi:hypothetical protein
MSFNQLDLQRMISSAKDTYEDNTKVIRTLKHSQKIADDVNEAMSYKQHVAKRNAITSLLLAKQAEGNGELDSIKDMKIVTDDEIAAECRRRCPFLYEHYNDIFERMVRDELDMEILFQMLNTLKDIEDGDLDQETGSIRVGKLLFNMYVDSRNKQTANEDKEKAKSSAPQSTMSWKEYKNSKKA